MIAIAPTVVTCGHLCATAVLYAHAVLLFLRLRLAAAYNYVVGIGNKGRQIRGRIFKKRRHTGGRTQAVAAEPPLVVVPPPSTSVAMDVESPSAAVAAPPTPNSRATLLLQAHSAGAVVYFYVLL
jgi:hypothetical protein